ncbi:MAG: chloride channel protein [Proteobacteria bacterium]|nr:chloride channel protein [Pseudomonadota bacterium]
MKSTVLKLIRKPHEALMTVLANEDTILLMLAILVGLFSSLGAIGFLEMIKVFRVIFWSPFGGELTGFTPGDIKVLLIPFLPALGGLIVGPVTNMFPSEAKGQGVPEVMESVILRGGILRMRTIFIRLFTSALCIGSGGSAGREGPVAHIGSAVGSYIAQVFKLSSNNIRTLLGAGAAGAIAATFNAPLAGTLFALEIILGEWHAAAFSPVIMSSVVATTVARYLYGNILAFEVPFYQMVNPVEIFFYILLGILTGAVALLFILTLDQIEEFFKAKVRLPLWAKPALGGLLLGCIGFVFPQVFGNGYDFMSVALMGNMGFGLMFSLVFLKILGTSLTLGSGGSGGVFAPTLYIGAMVGGTFGSIIHTAFPAVTATQGAYALVGMGALCGAACHAPLTAILLLFEMTGDYHIILPIMVSCIVSNLTIRGLFPHSIDSLKLYKKGINVKAGVETNVLQELKVREAMTTNVERIPHDMKFGDIVKYVTQSKNTSFPVEDQDGHFVGILSFQDVRQHVFDPDLEGLVVARDIANLHNVVMIAPTDSLKDALEKLAYRHVEHLVVLDPKNPRKILGILTRRDIISTYKQAIFRYDKTE